jgi:hypothetical protein
VNLEGAEADVGAELDDDVVTVARGGSLELLYLGVSEPDFRGVAVRRHQTLDGFFTFRRIISGSGHETGGYPAGSRRSTPQ